jgi:hypothetical protein
MSLILKQESSANVPTPPAGKGTIFLNASDQVGVKDSSGNVSTFPTVSASGNTQVFYNDAGSLTGDASFTFNKTNDTVTISNLTVTGTLIAGDIAVSSIANGTSNVDIIGTSGNVTVSVAGNANIMTVTDTGVNVSGTLNATGVITGNGSGLSSLAYANIDQFTTTGLTIDELYLQSVTRLVVTTPVFNYNIDQYAGDNPAIYVTSGQTIAFNLSVAGHPFLIQTSGNANYSTGLSHVSTTGTVTTGASAQGKTTGTLYWKVPYGITGNYKYQCQSHGSMNGNIVISDANVSNLSVSSATTAGTVTTAAQSNITSVGTLTSLYVGATSSNVDFPNAVQVSSQDNSGVTANDNIGLVGEAVANSANANVTGIGVLGVARAVGGTKGTGVQGQGHVTNTADTGAAVGIRGYATDTHSGGYNIGVLGNAIGSGVGNYAFYIQNGGIASIENATFWDLTDNSNAALTFNSTGKANIFGIETTDNAEGIFTSGYLNVVGNITATAGIKTDNYYYANGSPVDFQQAAGSNTQLQFNNANDFGASANLTFDTATNVLTVTGNANVTNLNASAAVSATGNVSAGNLTTGGVVSATGNVSGGNLTTAGALSVTGNANVGNIGGTGAVFTTVGGTLTTASQPNVTSVGTLTSLSVTGNVTAGNVYANSGTIGANVITGTTVGGTLTTAAQPNITSVGTLTSVTVSGNANVGNLNATSAVVASTLTSNVSTGTAPITVTSTTRVANLNVNYANVSDFGVVTAQSTGTYYPTFINGSSTANYALAANSGFSANLANGGLTATTFIGNLNGNVLGALANGTSSLSIPSSGGNVNISASGNANVFTVTGTGVNVAGTLNATGNANVGNLGATGVVATTLGGTLTTAAQPNITSVGTLSSLAVTGNVAAGNLTTTGVLSVTGTGVSSIAGNLDMTSNTIINLATPTNANDAATKQYVDDVAQGLHTHDSCNAATDSTLATISGGTVTYNNGTSGVGATLTTTGSYTTIDGVTLSNGMRILVKNEANTAHNGIYDRTSTTVLTRSTDFDTPAEMAGGDFTFVTAGTLYDNTGWVMTEPVTTVGTDPVLWAQFSGAGTYTAGTGLTLTGSQFSVNTSQTQVTALGTVTTGTWNSLVGSSATFAAGLSGANLASLNASNISSGTLAQARLANASLTVNGQSISLGGSGTITANTTQTLTLGSYLTGTSFNGGTAVTATVDATDAATANKVVSRDANASFSGNVITATTFSGSGASITTLNASNISSGTLAQARLANSSLTVNGTAISLGGSGTITANTTQTLTFGSYLTGTSFNGGTANTIAVDATTTNTASKVVARDASGNFAAGTITATLSGAATTAGTVTTAAQPNITSVGTLSSLAVTGNITSGNLSVSTGSVTLGTLTTGGNTTAGTVTGNWTLSAGSRWNATYADLAEKYVADADYEPGTVLVFGGEQEVTLANDFDSTRVAGVVTTNPAFSMNNECAGEHVAEIALQGRVPVKVHGLVAKGDLMVSGLGGYAVANNMARAGTIIGKALQNFTGTTGIIEVAVGRF